jgi:hypothetical protein
VIFNNGFSQTENLLLPDGASNQNMFDYSSNGWQVYTEKESTGRFYLFGYINGADYACEGDAANMGEYVFVDGKLSACFTQDSYVAVKRENNAAWYMTDGWLGTDVTSATLYDTSITGADSNKLYVPGGVECIFTLRENSDGTLTLSYERKNSEQENRYRLSGTLNGVDGNTELSLYPAGRSEPVVTEIVRGDRFEMRDLLPGEYLLKAGHADRVTRSYCVTIISEDRVVDVLLCRYGDVSGDGSLNMGDTAKLYSHIRETSLITDPYGLLCADIDQNGKLNLGDVARCYATVRS